MIIPRRNFFYIYFAAEKRGRMIRIHKAKTGDFLEIAGLDRRAWRGNRHSKYIPDGEHAWRLWAEHGLVYGARKDGKMVGAILAFPCLSGEFCIHKVFVAPLLRGKKIGPRLFEKLLQDLDRRGVCSFLTVDPGNENALALYAKWGFTDRRLVKGFYRKREDRFVLKRKPFINP
jgi:ribosomal protein S18 acetylase RimI-like enzyme